MKFVVLFSAILWVLPSYGNEKCNPYIKINFNKERSDLFYDHGYVDMRQIAALLPLRKVTVFHSDDKYPYESPRMILHNGMTFTIDRYSDVYHKFEDYVKCSYSDNLKSQTNDR